MANKTEITALALAEPTAEELGVYIVDVSYANGILCYYIDREGGVGIDECEKFSRAVEEVLDKEDIIATEYSLEVSSPGVERELVRDEHFETCTGEKIKVKLIRPLEGKREFAGVLESFDGHCITLRLEDGGAMCIDKKETSYIRLDDFSF